MINLIWDYADGLLSEEEADKMRLLIQENPLYQQQLNAILLEKKELTKLPLELPERSFADNVMAVWTKEKYETQKVFSPQKNTQLDWVIRSIFGALAAFTFIPLLLILVSGGKTKTNLPFDLTQKLTLPSVDYVGFLNNPYVYYTFYLGLIFIGLQYFDKLLLKKFTLT
jgi:hypothetical protein